MSAKKNLIFLFAGLGATFAALHSSAVKIGEAAGILTRDAIAVMVKDTISQYGFKTGGVDLVTIAKIESSFNPNAVRYEAHIRDVSTGLMQTLGSTARWLAEDMGYTAFAAPSNDDLLDAETSIYFGAAYIDWLSDYQGVERSEKWIVQSYNGGPGNFGSQTKNYYAKYLRNKGK